MGTALDFNLFVTNVEKEGQFLKVWGQRDHGAAKDVERVLQQHFLAFEKGLGLPNPKQLRVDDLCCARFNDGNDCSYYRARIVNLDLTYGFAECLFLDYGNKDKIPLKDIRLIQDDRSLFKIPAQASSFILSDVVGAWDPTTLKLIKDKLCYEEVKSLVVKVLGPQNQISLLKVYLNLRDYSEELVGLGLATHVPQPTFEVMVWSSLGALASGSIPAVPSPPVAPAAPAMNFNYPYPNSQQMMYLMWQNMMSASGMMPPSQVIPPMSSQVVTPQPPIGMPATLAKPNPVASSTLPVSGVEPGKQSFESLTTFSPFVLETNTDHKVYVSHVEKGTFSFAVQLQSNEDQLEKMMKTLNSPAMKFHRLKPPLVPGTICLAKCLQDDTICRAVVTGLSFNKSQVYYVDYGNSEALDCTSLFEIPPEFSKPKVMAVQFVLAGLTDCNLTDEMKQIFHDLVLEKECILRVSKPKCGDLSPMQAGELFIDDNNVKELINVKMLENRSKAAPKLMYRNVPLPEAGSKVKVVVGYVKSVDNFYVQLMSQKKDLENLMSDIEKYCSGAAKPLSEAEVQPGAVCCARFSGDEQWYRAFIVKADINDLSVMYVDYGNEEQVSLDELRRADNNLVNKLRAQAIPCCLSGFEDRGTDEDLTSRFDDLSIEKTFVMHVIKIRTEVPCAVVRLVDETGSDLADQLKCASETIRALPHSGSQPSCNIPSKAVESRQVKPKFEDFDSKDSFCPKKDPEAWGIGKHSGSERHHYSHCDRDSSESSRPTDNYSRGSYQKDDVSSHQRDADSRSSRSRDDSRCSQTRRDDFRSSRPTDDSCRNTRPRDNDAKPYGSRNDSESFRSRDSESKYCRSNGEDYKNSRPRDDFRGDERRNTSMSRQDAPKKDFQTSSMRMADTNQRTVNGFKDSSEDNWDDSPSIQAALAIPKLSVTLGSRKPVYLVYSNSPTDFYLQERSTDEGLQTLMDKLADQYSAGGDLLPSASLSVGAVCVAKYSEDDTWYRAIIQKVLSGSVEVFFCDYGNTQVVDVNDLKVISSELVTLCCQAIHCKLLGVPSSGCSDDQLSQFNTFVDSESLEAEFLDQEGDVYGIILRDSPSNVTINETFGASPESLIPPTSLVTSIKRTTLPPGCEKEVTVSWFVSPEKFFLQLKSCEEEFKDMMAKLQIEYKLKDSLSGPSLEQAVVARFKGDGALYRGQIKALRGDKYGILYVDYGNRALVEQSGVYGLEYRFADMPQQAIQCSLKGVKPLGDQWPKDNQDLKKIFEGSFTCTFHCETTLESGDITYSVSLSRNGVDVYQNLLDSKLATSADPPPEEPEDAAVDLHLLIGQQIPAYVVAVEDKKLFVTLDVETFNSKRQELAEFFKNYKDLVPLPPNQVAVDQKCLVLTPSGEYRRAFIVDPKYTAGVLVQFMDYSGCDEIICEKLFELPLKLASVPPLILECCAENIQDQHELLLELNVTLNILSYADGRLTAQVLDHCGHSFPFGPSDCCVKSLVPMPVMRSKMRVTVSHASGATVWLQQVRLETKVTDLLDNLFDSYEEGGERLESITVGTVCAAKSEDENWYRAEIVEQQASDSVVVQYLDYGNSEVLPVDNLKVLEDKFLSLHALAVKAILPIVTEDSTLGETILELTGEKVFTGVFVKREEWLVELLSGQTELSLELVRTGRALTMDDNPFPALLAEPDVQVLPATGSTLPAFVSYVNHASDFYIQLESDTKKLEDMQSDLQTFAHCMKTFEDPPQAGNMCMAMYSEDSTWYRGMVLPNSTIFFVDYGNTEAVELKDLKLLPPSLENVQKFAFHCSLRAPPGKQWSDGATDRLRDLVDTEETPTVTVVSEGDTMVVDLTTSEGNIADLLQQEGFLEAKSEDVKEVFIVSVNSPSDFLVKNADPLVKAGETMKCSLYLPSSIKSWSEAAVSHFKYLTANGTTSLFKMTTLIDGDPATVSLALNGKQIDEELVALCEQSASEPQSMEAVVVCTNSLSDFYVHLTKDKDSIDDMSKHLEGAIDFDPCSETQMGTVCAALFPDDNVWYRGKILSQSTEGFEVLFIDYGNIAVTSELRSLPPHLQKIPSFALHCTLPTPDGMSGWSDAAVEKFEEMAADGEAVFQIELLSSEEPYVTSLELSGNNILHELSSLSGIDASSIYEMLASLRNSMQQVRDSLCDPVAENAVVDASAIPSTSSGSTSDLPPVTSGASSVCRESAVASCSGSVILPIENSEVSLSDIVDKPTLAGEQSLPDEQSLADETAELPLEASSSNNDGHSLPSEQTLSEELAEKPLVTDCSNNDGLSLAMEPKLADKFAVQSLLTDSSNNDGHSLPSEQTLSEELAEKPLVTDSSNNDGLSLATEQSLAEKFAERPLVPVNSNDHSTIALAETESEVCSGKSDNEELKVTTSQSEEKTSDLFENSSDLMVVTSCSDQSKVLKENFEDSVHEIKEITLDEKTSILVGKSPDSSAEASFLDQSGVSQEDLEDSVLEISCSEEPIPVVTLDDSIEDSSNDGPLLGDLETNDENSKNISEKITACQSENVQLTPEVNPQLKNELVGSLHETTSALSSDSVESFRDHSSELTMKQASLDQVNSCDESCHTALTIIAPDSSISVEMKDAALPSAEEPTLIPEPCLEEEAMKEQSKEKEHINQAESCVEVKESLHPSDVPLQISDLDLRSDDNEMDASKPNSKGILLELNSCQNLSDEVDDVASNLIEEGQVDEVHVQEVEQEDPDMVVTLTAFTSEKLCESDVNGVFHGMCDAKTSDFEADFHQMIPGQKTYTFVDCENHNLVVEIESSNHCNGTSSVGSETAQGI